MTYSADYKEKYESPIVHILAVLVLKMMQSYSYLYPSLGTLPLP